MLNIPDEILDQVDERDRSEDGIVMTRFAFTTPRFVLRALDAVMARAVPLTTIEERSVTGFREMLEGMLAKPKPTMTDPVQRFQQVTGVAGETIDVRVPLEPEDLEFMPPEDDPPFHD